MTTSQERKFSYGVWIAWAGIVGLYVLIRIPLLDVPLDRDEGAFGQVGLAILDGQLPYRDIFDHKPPGVFYLFALALAIVPPTAFGLHLFLLVWNFATLLCVASLARALGGARAALWSAFLYALVSASFSTQGFTVSSEMLLLLPLVASLRLTLAGLRAHRDLWIVLAGAVGAAACWIKQPAALPLSVAPLILVAHYGAKGWMRGLEKLLLWLAGGVALSLLVILPFVAAGAWNEFWYWSFTHSVLYTETLWSGSGEYLFELFSDVLRDAGFVLIVGFGGGVLGWISRRPHAWIGVVFLLLSTGGIVYTRFATPHYFAFLVPAAALAAGTTLARLQDDVAAAKGEAAGRVVVVIGVVLALTAPLVGRTWYWTWPDSSEIISRSIPNQAFEAGPMLADYLRERTASDDWIFIYGSEPQIPLLAGRHNANPFVMIYPLTRPYPRHREFQKAVWAQIESVQPVYFLLPLHPLSQFRGRGMSFVFEQQIFDLRKRAYHLEACLLHSDTRGQYFHSPTSGRRCDQQPGTMLIEIWRLNESG